MVGLMQALLRSTPMVQRKMTAAARAGTIAVL
jgi:hypothetical protein